jgi:hypothetical protein
MGADTADQVTFFQHHLPALKAGEYEITVTQEIASPKITSENSFTTSKKFSVRGDRFSLKPTDVQAVFPPAGSLSDHSNVLPHIMLHRSTLPWERRADPNPRSPETPWLALLLFHQGEVPDPKIVSLKDLNREGAKFPLLVKDRGQNDDDKVTIIEVRRKILAGILPGKEELGLLTHVRGATDYVITDQTLAALKTNGVLDNVLVRLAGIKDHIFLESELFLAALKKAIGDHIVKYRETIVSHAVERVELAVIIGNRLPLPKGISVAHLVSVEGRYNAQGFDYQDAGEDDLVRLVSLQSWSFACLDHQQSFTGLLTGLNCTPSVLRLPECDAAAANDYLALGAAPLWHGLRQGGKTVSWYHGPLAPAENQLPEGDPSAPIFPARAADELTRYSPATGMFDVSYAAAWELGRLLALQSKTFSVNLYNWKRAHAQELRQIEEELLHSSPLDDGSEQGSNSIPHEVANWFKRLSLLQGLPFNYLVPDERMLPVESIRFFQLDWLWIDCMLDGAFSLGRVTSADHRRDAAHIKSPAANPHKKVSGLLMRSDVVAGWPGLLADGYNGKEKLNLLRMDRLSANVLVCLFKGNVTAVDFHLRPETAHFGLHEGEGKYYKKLRDQQGNESGLMSGAIQFQKGLAGVAQGLGIGRGHQSQFFRAVCAAAD